MENIIIILIIIAYSIYKIMDRICSSIDMQTDSEEFKIIKVLAQENTNLIEKILEKEEK